MSPQARNFCAATVSSGRVPTPLGLALEATALQHSARLPALAGRSPLLRLQTDERLVALIRRGHQGAFEALVQRYQPRLLAFCRHMLGSREDAEDVLQEVFAASFNALCADDRPINARPWLYRIARNRCLNHLRRPRRAGPDSMDVFERDGGSTTADTVHQPRGVPPDRRRRPGAARDPAHRAAPARDRRSLLRPDRRGDGHDGAERQVAARPRARGARRGGRGAAAHLRRGAPRARPGRGGHRQDLAADPPPPEELRPLPHFPGRAAQDHQARSPRSTRSAPLLFIKKLWVAKLGFGEGPRAPGPLPASGGGAAAGAGSGRRGRRGGRRHHRRRSRFGRPLHDRLEGRGRDGRRRDRHRRRRRGQARDRTGRSRPACRPRWPRALRRRPRHRPSRADKPAKRKNEPVKLARVEPAPRESAPAAVPAVPPAPVAARWRPSPCRPRRRCRRTLRP